MRSKSKVLRKTFLVTTICIVSLGLFISKLVLTGGTTINPDSIFEFNNVEYSRNYNVGEDVFGLHLSTTKSGSSIKTKAQGGRFDLKFSFLPTSSQTDFDSLVFEFTSTQNTNRSFSLQFVNDNHDGNVIVNYRGVPKYFKINGLDYLNKSSQISVIFDSNTMSLSIIVNNNNYNLVNFLSEADMLSFGSLTHEVKYDTYNVNISLNQVKSAKKAQVVFIELNGESLGSEFIEDKGAPTLYGDVKNYNGTINKKYTISSNGLKSYDICDGIKNFNGDVKVYDPSKKEVKLDNLSFTPKTSGTYEVLYYPKDSSSNIGQPYKSEFLINRSLYEISLEYNIPFNNQTITTNSTLIIPKVSALLSYSENNVNKINASVRISCNGEVVYDKLIENSFEYTFNDANTYEVSFYANTSNGHEVVDTYSVYVVDADKIERDIVSNIMGLNTNFIVPKAYLGGKQLTYEVVSPNLTTSNNEQITLNQVGIWTIRYQYTINDTSYY